MKSSFLYGLAIATTFSLAIVSCTPSTPTASTSPTATATTSASPTATAKPTTSPSASPSATAKPTTSPSASPSASATPSESPKPTSSATSPSADAKPDKPTDTVRIAVVNNSGKVLKAIYMSAPSKQDWGDNELDAPLADREKADFEWKRSDYKGDDAGCVFDIGAEYADGTKTVLDPIDVCKTPAINLK